MEGGVEILCTPVEDFIVWATSTYRPIVDSFLQQQFKSKKPQSWELQKLVQRRKAWSPYLRREVNVVTFMECKDLLMWLPGQFRPGIYEAFEANYAALNPSVPAEVVSVTATPVVTVTAAPIDIVDATPL
eukprot:3937109-Rhodomonas_salina.1